MQRSTGKAIFELTSESEAMCYAKLKDYFESMYFAN